MGEVEPRFKSGRTRSTRRLLAKRALAASHLVVHERSRGRCEARTPWCEGAATQVHHRAGRGFAGCHDPLLLLDLCGTSSSGCHGYIESHRTESYERGWLLKRNGPVVQHVRDVLAAREVAS